MKVGILGSGMVGRALSAKVVSVRQEVTLGTRDVDALMARDEADAGRAGPFAAWHADHPDVGVGTSAEAAARGEIVCNATAGASSLESLALAGEERLNGEILIDVANPSTTRRGCRRA